MNYREKCENCRYFLSLSILSQSGECRLNPPKGNEGFARVSFYDWCGQFVRKLARSF